MPTIIEEIEADQNPRAQCKLCAWISGRTPAEQAQWDSVCSTARYTKQSIFRALARREAGVGKSCVERHVGDRHRQAPAR